MNFTEVHRLRIVQKVLEKLHIGRFIPDFLFKLQTRKDKEIIEMLPDSETADKFLDSLYKDPKSSAVSQPHEIDPVVDLEIIVPVYNVEKYIDACIRSVLDQKTTYSYKLVVVNDGSPDRCGELLKAYESDERVTIITQENKGLPDARNRALNPICGKYVYFLDSDDTLPENTIQSLMDVACQYDADIVEGSMSAFTDDGKTSINYKNKYCVKAEKASLHGFPVAKVYRAELFRTVQFPRSYWWDDSIMMMLVVAQADLLVTIPQFVYNYRTNPESISHSFRGKPKSLDSFYVTRSLLKDQETLNIDRVSGYSIDSALYQFKYNWHRTYDMGVEVEKAIFVLTCDLFDKYYGNQVTKDKKYMDMQKALENRDFYLYRRECCYM